MARVTYTFAGITFTRIISGDYPTWFPINATYKADPILDSDTQYVDVGGSVPQPLQVRAVFATAGDRTSMLSALGDTGTLTRSTGESRTATLVATTPLAALGGVLLVADLTFVAT